MTVMTTAFDETGKLQERRKHTSKVINIYTNNIGSAKASKHYSNVQSPFYVGGNSVNDYITGKTRDT